LGAAKRLIPNGNLAATDFTAIYAVRGYAGRGTGTGGLTLNLGLKEAAMVLLALSEGWH